LPHLGTLGALRARAATGMAVGDVITMAERIGWHSVAENERKAAVGATQSGFALNTATERELTGFIDSLRGYSLAARVAASAQQWPLHSVVSQLSETGFTATEIGEDVEAPIVQLPNGGIVVISPNKVSAIIVMSDQLAASNNAATAIENELIRAVSRGIDAALVSRVLPGSAGSFGATANAAADFAELVSILAVTGTEPLVCGAAIDVINRMAGLVQDGAEIFPLVNFIGAGEHKGIPIVPSTAVPAGDLLLIDPSGLQCRIEAVNVVASRTTSLFMSDLPSGAAQMISLFQGNLLALRCDCTFSMAVLRGIDVSASCSGISWASGS